MAKEPVKVDVQKLDRERAALDKEIQEKRKQLAKLNLDYRKLTGGR